MADQTHHTSTHETSSGGNAGLAFIVGALVVAVAVIAFFMFGGEAGTSDDVTVTIEGAGDAVEGAAAAVEGAAEGAAGAVEEATE